ncbi:hypothetical protein ALT_0980 [Aspergillus lentulus]|uniref:Uncharacterized protein n=1 Tax=Aspergillus lentulus TaxID=293939 RepID=A0AAN4T7C1_ASPLE|nr:hypothetical protein ALT_0980 [Aspergillus lentulus]
MSYPNLSTILEVYPECEYNCYGASWLLKEGTRFLQHGLPVDGLLIELAPLVLCTRFHKYQANDLVRDWRAKLRAFQQQTLLDSMLKSLQELVDSRARSLAAGSARQRVSGRGLSPTRLERSAAIVTEEEPATIEREEEDEERGDRADEPEPQPEPQPSPRRTSTEASSPAVPSDARAPTVPQSEPRTATRKPIEGDCDICMCPLRGQGSDEDGEGSEDSDDDNDNDNDVSNTASDNEHDDNEEGNLDDLVYCKNHVHFEPHAGIVSARPAPTAEQRGHPDFTISAGSLGVLSIYFAIPVPS